MVSGRASTTVRLTWGRQRVNATRAGETPGVQQTLRSPARGYVLHSGVDAATQTTLADLGFHVMLQEV